MDVVLDNLDVYWDGLRTTVSLTALSFGLAFAIGLAVAACRVSPVPPLRAAAFVYVETIRNTPLAVLFLLFYYTDALSLPMAVKGMRQGHRMTVRSLRLGPTICRITSINR